MDVKKTEIWIEALAPKFWLDHAKCYELHMVMHQSDMKFIHTLNKFRTSSHTQIVINTLNNTCL
jgi:hypothetical protein